MIRTSIILAALVALPLTASALSIVADPDCSDGTGEYYSTRKIAGDLRVTTVYGPSNAGTAMLISCQAGAGVAAKYKGETAFDFFEMVEQMIASNETYSFEDVAKFAREGGWDARKVNINRAACVCAL